MKINWIVDWEKLQGELSYQKIAPAVTYQDIAVSILLDVISKNKRIDEDFALTDSYDANISKILSDEVILSDSVVKFVIRDYFGDTVSLTDVLNTANEFLRDRFEEIHASDLESDALLNTSLIGEFLLNNALSTSSRVTVTPGSKTDLTTMSDVYTTVTSPRKTDIATVSDVLAAVSSKLFSDTANISDAPASTIHKYFSSGLSLDDFADINKSVNGVKGNIAVMGDTISVSLLLSRMLGTRLLNEITLN
jgi:hypothetical protein